MPFLNSNDWFQSKFGVYAQAAFYISIQNRRSTPKFSKIHLMLKASQNSPASYRFQWKIVPKKTMIPKIVKMDVSHLITPKVCNEFGPCFCLIKNWSKMLQRQLKSVPSTNGTRRWKGEKKSYWKKLNQEMARIWFGILSKMFKSFGDFGAIFHCLMSISDTKYNKHDNFCK